MKPTGNESPIIEIGGKLYSISELKKLSDKEIYSLIKKYRAEGSKKAYHAGYAQAAEDFYWERNNMKVYIVVCYDLEEHERCISKVFDTEEKAKQYCEEDSDTLIGKTYYEAEVE